jgi:hypothetical protein
MNEFFQTAVRFAEGLKSGLLGPQEAILMMLSNAADFYLLNAFCIMEI